jgi:hypothetical protein
MHLAPTCEFRPQAENGTGHRSRTTQCCSAGKLNGRTGRSNSPNLLQQKTGSGHSNLSGECRRLPRPVFQGSLERRTALPLKLDVRHPSNGSRPTSRSIGRPVAACESRELTLPTQTGYLVDAIDSREGVIGGCDRGFRVSPRATVRVSAPTLHHVRDSVAPDCLDGRRQTARRGTLR